jgi:hypothetical protein
MLKNLEVIGARARNWPIRDGKEQARLIASSAASVAQSNGPAASSRRSTASQGPDDVTITERPTTGRSSRSTTSNAMNDPHATLNLFQPREVEQEQSNYSQPIAPRSQSAKPPPRDLSELFVGEDPKSPSPAGTTSPQKARNLGKVGGGKNYKPNRLFDEAEESAATPGGIKTAGVKTNAKKYNHFEFGQGEEDEATPKAKEAPRPTRTKHQSQWDFEDFVTPEKIKTKVLPQAVRQFGWSDDEVGPFLKSEFVIVV